MYYAQPQAVVRTDEQANDLLWVTYRWMSLGLATTGLVALGLVSSPALFNVLLSTPFLLPAVFIAQLAIVWTFRSVALRSSTPVVGLLFFLYAILSGVTFTSVFMTYARESIASTFFVTAGAFGGMAAFGAMTKSDLSGIGRFGMMAFIGLVLAMVANIFLGSSMLGLLISLVGVVLFAGLTAYDTQRLKALFASGAAEGNLPLVGALMLYLDFINMFLFLLRLFGRRR